MGTGGGEGGGPAITAGSGLPSPIRKPRPWEQESHSSRPFLSIRPSGPLLHSFSSSPGRGGAGRGGGADDGENLREGGERNVTLGFGWWGDLAKELSLEFAP